MTDGLVVLALLAALYFFPTLIAALRGRPNTMAIFALNLFLGWTLLGWVMALVWALSSSGQPTVVNQHVVVGQSLTPKGKPEKQKRCYACAEWILKDAMKCKHCGEMQVGHGEAAKRVKPTILDAPAPTPVAPEPADNRSISIANWASDSPSARVSGIDWERVDHPDRNRGRTG